jgi:hypothetical protein
MTSDIEDTHTFNTQENHVRPLHHSNVRSHQHSYARKCEYSTLLNEEYKRGRIHHERSSGLYPNADPDNVVGSVLVSIDQYVSVVLRNHLIPQPRV